MPIHIDSRAELETIVVKTRSSVYEPVVLRGERGEVLLRGGRHLKEFRRVLFLGSTAEVTSAVESLSRRLVSANYQSVRSTVSPWFLKSRAAQPLF